MVKIMRRRATKPARRGAEELQSRNSLRKMGCLWRIKMTEANTREELLQNNTVRQQIEERAYFIAESHGFAPGREIENWLSAEEEVLASLLPVSTETINKVVKKATAAKAAANGTARKTTAKVANAAPVADLVDGVAKPAPRKRAPKKTEL
jgi:uncharacterized protein YcbX